MPHIESPLIFGMQRSAADCDPVKISRLVVLFLTLLFGNYAMCAEMNTHQVYRRIGGGTAIHDRRYSDRHLSLFQIVNRHRRPNVGGGLSDRSGIRSVNSDSKGNANQRRPMGVDRPGYIRAIHDSKKWT